MGTERSEKKMLVLGVIIVLAGAVIAGKKESYDHVRSRRQVTYLKKVNDSKEDAADHDGDFLSPVTSRPLPSQVAYPGDLSRFFPDGATTTPETAMQKLIDDATDKNASSTDEHLQRKKRGGYVLESKPASYSPRQHTPNNDLLHTAASDQRLSHQFEQHQFVHQKVPGNVIPSEMSFEGAGFLRTDEEPGLELISSRPTKIRSRNNIHTGPNSNNYGSTIRNSQAVNDFRAAFDPSTPRKSNAVQYNDYDGAQGQSHDDQERIKAVLQERAIQKSSELVRVFDSLKNHQALRNRPSPVPPNKPVFVRVMKQNAPISKNPFASGHPHYIFDQPLQDLPQKTEESFIDIPHSASFQIIPKFPPQGRFPSFSQQLMRKAFRSKRSTSAHQTSHLSSVKHSDFEASSQETQNNYHVEDRKDQHGADSGFIPISGSYDGGVIHLSLPYFGRPSPPSYGSPNPVHVIHTYSSPPSPPPPPSGPQSRHYGSSVPSEHFFHPSEARRYSYGVLGSGNFEVIRGGLFPENNHGGGHHGGGGYHSGRTPYGGSNNYNNYGTTEVIFDGPIQGFQGFDNFPAHLINALSKHAEVTMHAPPERRQDESQLIPVSYPLQAVS